jgi:hypothetical protein
VGIVVVVLKGLMAKGVSMGTVVMRPEAASPQEPAKVISETISQMVIAAGMANLPEDGTGRTREDTDTREHVSMSF